MAASPQGFAAFMRLPTAAKAGLLVAVLVVVGLLYFAIFHRNISTKIAEERKKAMTLEIELEEAQVRQQNYLKLRAELRERDAVDRRNLRVLPDQAEIAPFLQDLDRVAQLSSLEILTVEPRPEETQDMLVRIPVALSLSGRFHHITKFFVNAGRLERAVNMENIQISGPQVKDEQVIVKVTVLATTFRRREAAKAKAPPKPSSE